MTAATVTVATAGIDERPRFRGALHTWAFAAGVPIGAALVAYAPAGPATFGTLVYALGVEAMLGVSALYHRMRWSRPARAFMRRLDHSTIFLAIAGTYTAVGVIALDGRTRLLVLGAVWAGSAIGIALQWLPRVPRALVHAPYLVVGWTALLALPSLWSALGPAAFVLIVAGGVVYSLGSIVLAVRRPDPRPALFGYHEVFHACTVVALALHLVAIAYFVLPRA
jgi:hemolysin III